MSVPEPTHPAATEEQHPESTALAGEQKWRRLHPLSPLLRGGIVLLIIVGIIFANFRDRLIALWVGEEYYYDDVPSEGDLIAYLVDAELLVIGILVCIAILVVGIGFAWLSWRFHTFRVTPEAVEERSGVVFRQHRRAPIERIQSVNLQRPLIARLVGLTQVEVQTAGQSGKVTLSYLGFSAAKAVREDILSRTARGRIAGLDVAEAPSSGSTSGAAATATAPHLLERRAADFLDSDVQADSYAAGTVVQVPVGRLVGSIVLGWDLWIPMLLTVLSIVGAVLWDPFLLTLVIPAALMTIAITFGSFNKGFRFTLSRNSDGVRIGAGLTATTTESIPFGRIHAIEARQPIGWRLCGWWKMRITTAGNGIANGGQNKMQNMVLPVGSAADVERVFATLMPGLADTDEQRAALRDGLFGSQRTGGYTAAGKASPWVLWAGARRTGIRIDESGRLAETTLRMRRGWLTRNFIVMPLVRAQSIQLSRPLLQRFIGLATITAHTVMGPVQVYVRGLNLGEARNFFAECDATVIAVQRADSLLHRSFRGAATGQFRTAARTTAVPVFAVEPPLFTRPVTAYRHGAGGDE